MVSLRPDVTCHSRIPDPYPRNMDTPNQMGPVNTLAPMSKLGLPNPNLLQNQKSVQLRKERPPKWVTCSEALLLLAQGHSDPRGPWAISGGCLIVILGGGRLPRASGLV